MKFLFLIFVFVPFSVFTQSLNTESIVSNYNVTSPEIYTLNREVLGSNDTKENLYYSVRNSELEKLVELNCYYKLKNKWKKINVKSYLNNSLSSSFKSDVEYLLIPIPPLSKFKIISFYKGSESVLISSILLNHDNIDTLVTKITIPSDYTISFNESINSDFTLQDSTKTYVFKDTTSSGITKSVAILIHLKTEDKITYFNKWYLNRLSNVDGKDIKNLNQIGPINTDTLLWINNVFNMIQTKISYVDIEEGLGAFVPRSPTSTWRNKYGDCKDMAFLLTSIFQSYGIQANMAISRTLAMESLFDFPSISLANHAICVVKFNEKTYYLDATDTYCKFGDPSSQIQNCEILIIDSLNPKFEKIIAIPPMGNLDSTNYYFDLEDKTKNRFVRYLKGKAMNEFIYKKSSFSEDHFLSKLNDESIYRHEKLSFMESDSLFLISASPILLPENYSIYEGYLMLPKSIFMDVDFINIDTSITYFPLYRTYKKTQSVRILVGKSLELNESYNYSFKNEYIQYKIEVLNHDKEIKINETFFLNKVSLTNDDIKILNKLSNLLQKRKEGYLLIKFV